MYESEKGADFEIKYSTLAPAVWEGLAKVKRTGWVNRGIENPETVQEHTLSLRKLVIIFEELSDADRSDLLDMLEIHDWPEAIDGDEVILTTDPEEGKQLKAAKFLREQQTLTDICQPLGEIGKRIVELWRRFETSADEVASSARQLDKYQAIEKSFEYEKAQGKPLFKEFLEHDRKNISNPILLKRLENLEKEWLAGQANV